MNELEESLPRTPKVSEVVADRLRSLILRQEMRPGDRLSSEPELIARFGVARGTIREALRLLEAEGIIEIKRGKQGGILVRQPDVTQIGHSITLFLAMNRCTLRELMDFRLLLEPATAAAAARAASEEQCAVLRKILESEARHELEHSVEFHETLAAFSNNTFYEVILASMRHEMLLHSTQEQLSKADMEATRKAHQAIVDAVTQHDPERAEKAMRRHIEQFRNLLEKQGRLDEAIIAPSRWPRS